MAITISAIITMRLCLSNISQIVLANYVFSTFGLSQNDYIQWIKAHLHGI